MILRQKPCEQHPMPLLVSALLRKMVNGPLAFGIRCVAELLRPRPELVAQRPLRRRHVPIRLVMRHPKRFERIRRRPLRQIARRDASALQFVPQVCGEGGHDFISPDIPARPRQPALTGLMRELFP
jgi:hypothetical protein